MNIRDISIQYPSSLSPLPSALSSVPPLLSLANIVYAFVSFCCLSSFLSLYLLDILNGSNVVLEANSSGLFLQSMDSTHISLVSFALLSPFFIYFHCPHPVTLGIPIKSLCAILNILSDTGDKIQLSYSPSDYGDKLLVLSFNDKTSRNCRFELSLLDIEEDRLVIPEQSYSVVVSLPTQHLLSNISKLKTLGADSVDFIITEKDIGLRVKGQLGEGEIRIAGDNTHNPIETMRTKRGTQEDMKAEEEDEEEEVKGKEKRKKSKGKEREDPVPTQIKKFSLPEDDDDLGPIFKSSFKLKNITQILSAKPPINEEISLNLDVGLPLLMEYNLMINENGEQEQKRKKGKDKKKGKGKESDEEEESEEEQKPLVYAGYLRYYLAPKDSED